MKISIAKNFSRPQILPDLFEREQGSEPIIHALFRVLLALEVALRRQNRGVTEELNLLEFAPVGVA